MYLQQNNKFKKLSTTLTCFKLQSIFISVIRSQMPTNCYLSVISSVSYCVGWRRYFKADTRLVGLNELTLFYSWRVC